MNSMILFRRKSYRVDYLVQSLSSAVNVNNLTPPPNSAFDQLYGMYVNVSFERLNKIQGKTMRFLLDKSLYSLSSSMGILDRTTTN